MVDSIQIAAGSVGAAETNKQTIVDGSGHSPTKVNEPQVAVSGEVQAHEQPPPRQDFGPHYEMGSNPTSGRHGAYNMMPMATALPQVSFRPQHQHHGGQPQYQQAMPHPMMQHLAPMSHYGPSPPMNMTPQGFYNQQQPSMAQYYPDRRLSPQSQPQMQNLAYYSNQMMMGQPVPGYYYSPNPRYVPQSQGIPVTMPQAQYVASAPPPTNDHRFNNGAPYGVGAATQPSAQGSVPSERRQSASAVRGPPRKPRQSGFAIWIGNLPPQTDLMSLVDHVCREVGGLESLFLISKSNCAFANFKDEKACMEAQQKLHDSKFQSVRLVSRLRKATTDGGATTTATASSPTSTEIAPDEASNMHPLETKIPSPNSLSPVSSRKGSTATADGTQHDRFFILKSLTVEDLDLSVKTGIWATQSHNEVNLNNAFKNADNVYLVFSANKSGEYFGYARMLSEMDEDPAAAIEFAPTCQVANEMDLPKAIPTDATEFAPRGQIIDDSSRGTIFWEWEHDDSDNGSSGKESESGSVKGGDEADEETKTWGKPFHLEWLSTAHLPFYRTRGLRNPWNSNREVKIARDGTELEPSIGRRLIGLFNRQQGLNQFAPAMRTGMPPTGYPRAQPYGA